MQNVFFPSYTIGPDAYNEIPSVCPRFGRSAVIIGGKHALAAAEADIRKAAGDALTITGTFWYGGDSTFENAEALEKNPEIQKADMIFAVGGGRAVDTCKCAAEHMNKPIFAFPTLASNCAPVTAVCVIYYPDHRFRQVWYRSRPPFHTFINTKIIAEAPREYLWAGIGDALSKQYESLFSSRGKALDYVEALGIQIASGCSEGLLSNGEAALKSADQKKVSPELERVAQNIILTTGLVSNCVPEQYNSSIAHGIYYSHCSIPRTRPHLHGAVVCYGVLVLLTLDKQIEERDRVFDFCCRTGLPHCLDDVEMKQIDLDAFFTDVLKTPDLTHIPYPVTKKMLLDAMQNIESYNDAHK